MAAMALPTRHLFSQGRVLAALGGTVAEVAARRLGLRQPLAADAVVLPGPEERAVIAPPPARLVRDFVRHVGGDPGAWRDRVPPHLFPQWAVPLAARTLRGLPYPLLEVVNGGCRLEMRAPLRRAPLSVSARLIGIEDDGRRAVLRQQVITANIGEDPALVADLFVIVPSRPRASQPRSGGTTPGRRDKPTAQVPDGARELGFWRLPANAGLAFGLLTGDVNPIHWVRPYARAAGFSRPILHGFSTMARALEGIWRGLFTGAIDRVGVLDVRFTRPLALPARVGLYVKDSEIFVGDAPGGPAYLTGHFSERAS